ncbi:MAG: heme ABC exporter ATP-binding protein CcmA [Anaerolineales bacterium]|nr:heme ABC exporter ATP-binding protein CcmA [Anaerolineales bacterium]
MIETRALTKSFGLRPVLRGLDLEVAAGECVALFGPNGAGKTTLLRILATLSKPTSGLVRVAGFTLPAQAEAARRRLSLLAHQPLLYGDLTAEENLTFYSRLYNLRDGAAQRLALLERVGLAARRRDLVRTFSRGMWQRLALARALLSHPEVLLMDEPYTGLDPAGAALLDDVLAEVKARGCAVLLTMHDIAHGLALADRALILTHGKITFTAQRGQVTAAQFAEHYDAATRQ